MIEKLFLVGLFLGVVLGGETFDKIVDDFWEWRMRNNPEFASNIGDHRYTADLEDYSLDAIDTRKREMDAFLVRLDGIDTSNFASVDRISYHVLRDTIQTWVDGYKWKNYGPMNPLSLMEGIQSLYDSRAGLIKFDSQQSFEDFAVRISKYATQLDQIMERLRLAIEEKTTHARESVVGVPSSLDNIYNKYKNNVTSFPMYEPYQTKLDSIVTDQAIRDSIRTTAQQAITDLLEKINEVSAFMTQEYIPNARSTFGVGGLPNGAEYYKACLKWQLSTDITADEIHRLGLREVNRINDELQKIVKRANFAGNVQGYNEKLRNDSSLFIYDPDVAIESFTRLYQERILPKLNRTFKDIPNVPLEIKKMPWNGPNGIYKNGAPDGSRPGVFYANVMSKVPKFDMAALLLHETDPGHHLQDAFALTAEGIPLFRKTTDFSKYFAVPLHFPFYTAYSEGWGLYSEDLGEELDIFESDLERFGKYGLEIFRAARLVVDTGIHAKGWSRDRAIDYMMNYTAYTQDFIEREIDRYATWPAQATSYMIGKLKIWELRNRATGKLCKYFDIKEFHSILLKNGAMPLSVMEMLVDEWIDDVRGNQPTIDTDCLNQIVDDFWEWRMKNNPEFASNIGDHRYTDMLEDFSLEAFEPRKMFMDKLLVRVGYVDRDLLSTGNRVTLDVLKDTIQTYVDGYKWRFYGPMNPMSRLEGIHTNFGSRAGLVKFAEEGDFRKFATRIQKYGKQIDQIIVRMSKAVAVGTTYHLKSVESVPASLEEVYTKYRSNITAFPMYEPFTTKLDDIVSDTAKKTEIRNTAKGHITTLLNKMNTLAEFIKTTYIPNTRSSFGVGGLPDGDQYYKACLKWQLSTDITADEVHEQGLREVEKVFGKIQRIMKKGNFSGTVEEYNELLRQNESMFINDADVAIQAFKDVYNKRILPKLDTLFEGLDNIPENMSLIVKKMTYDGPNGIYKNGAPDFSRPGIFYANVRSKIPTFDMMALMLHESDPGHHLQDSFALIAQGIPLFRKVTDFSKYYAAPLHFPFYTAYSEGWGLYAEDLGEKGDLDLYKDDIELFGKYGIEIFRAARLVVDTGIHAKNWSRDHAIEYMKNYTAYSPESIAKEIDRYSTWPGQATSYMVGKIKIQELRLVAEQRLCNFKEDKLIKKFHSVILRNGAMPLSVMSDEVTKWMNSELLKNVRSGRCLETSGVQSVNNVHIGGITLIFTSLVTLTFY